MIYKRIDNLYTIFDDSGTLCICIISFDSFFFFIALNQTLPMFTKSICNKNISVILSFYTSFAMKETKGGWEIFKIINFSKKQLFRINGEIKINRSAHIYIFFTMEKPVYIIHFIITPRERKKKVKKPKSSK